ncbi:MAG: hypothetical protein WD200_04570 [Candidatus Andersenbacteria bacterium]
MRILRVGLTVALVGLWGGVLFAHAQEESPTPTPTVDKVDELTKTQQEIAAKQAEIAEIDKQIQNLAGKRDQTAAEAEIIASRVKQLEGELAKAQLELKQTTLTIQKVQTEQLTAKEQVGLLQQEIELKRDQLRSLLRALYQQEQDSFIRIFFDSSSLSEVLSVRAAYAELQERTITVIKEMHVQEEELTAQQQQLEQQEQDLGQLADLLSAQKSEVANKEAEQEKFLAAKKEEQAAYEQKIKEAQDARKEIEEHVFTLKDAGVKVTLENAFDMARYASKLTGVRASLLLGVLKVESNVGNNLGSGVYPDDMHPGSREAFVRITDKLGLDRKTAQISARPKSLKGWGGAMGPAQIMPATWEAIEPRLEQLTGKSPVNPYELTDAFVATAIFLADRGAARPEGEREAVGRYIAGPNWQYYSWYIDRVMAVADEYAKEGI